MSMLTPSSESKSPDHIEARRNRGDSPNRTLGLLLKNQSDQSILLSVSETLSTAEAKELLRLCKTGRLFDVQDWIASGKPLSVPSTLKTTPLEVALNAGLHSLVEVLIHDEESQQLKNSALSQARSLKRLDLIELLVLHGADIRSVPFIDVLYLWDPSIIRFFIAQGADFITGFPFAVAFREKNPNRVRSMARVQGETSRSRATTARAG